MFWTKEDIDLMRNSYQKVIPFKKQFRTVFYAKIMELEPDTIPIFRQEFLNFDSLPDSLGFMLDQISQETFDIKAVKALGLKHKTYGVKKKHFPLLKAGLEAGFRMFLQKEYTEELHELWMKTVDFFNQNMILGYRRK